MASIRKVVCIAYDTGNTVKRCHPVNGKCVPRIRSNESETIFLFAVRQLPV